MDPHQELDNIADDFALMTVDQVDDNVVLPIELTNATGTCLQQLNTHCSMEIFSSDSLTLTDLCSIAETCTRFKEIAEMIFPKDLSLSNVHNDDDVCQLESKKYGTYRCHIQIVRRVLKNFGPYVSAVSMHWGRKLVKPVAKYCGAATLQRLDIWGLGDQNKGLIMKLKTVFQRVLALSFYHCDLMAFVACPNIDYDSLIELEITYSDGCVAVLRNTFPKLERFTFYRNWMFSKCYDRTNEPYSEILPNFLQRHKRLRTLRLSSEGVCCSSQLMETIANNCTELTNLTLKWWHSPKTSFNFSNLKNLRKLSMLTVTLHAIDHRQLIALLEVLKSLTTLKLSCMWGLKDGSQLFSVLSQLPNLRELHLNHGYFHQIPWSRLSQLKALYFREFYDFHAASHFAHIIRELTNLEVLVFTNSDYEEDRFELCSEHFSEIVKIVERRPNKLTLKCHLSKDLAKKYVPNTYVNLIEYTDYKYGLEYM